MHKQTIRTSFASITNLLKHLVKAQNGFVKRSGYHNCSGKFFSITKFFISHKNGTINIFLLFRSNFTGYIIDQTMQFLFGFIVAIRNAID